MTVVSALDSSRLTVLLDVRHPLAYLALGPSAALADDLGSEINWLPIVGPPLRPPSRPAPDDDRGVRHRRFRAQAIAREIEIYAEAQGLVLRDYYRDVDASALNMAWLWLRESHREQLERFLAEAFRAYWAQELVLSESDSSDRGALAAIVDSLGLDGGEFQSWCTNQGVATAEALADELRERGLSGAPCYLVEDEVFLGRQHLPMIHWILTGRAGPVPI